jgi:hypothetical protein
MHHFSAAELALIQACNGQKIDQIYYYEWLNEANPKAAFTFIDRIELLFESGEKLIIGIHEEDLGMSIAAEFDFETEKRDLAISFGSKIRLIKHRATFLEIWSEILMNNLLKTIIEETEEGQSSKAIFLDFGLEKRVIFHHPEMGLLVDIYEDE